MRLVLIWNGKLYIVIEKVDSFKTNFTSNSTYKYFNHNKCDKCLFLPL